MQLIALKTLPLLAHHFDVQDGDDVQSRLAISYCPSMDLIATYSRLHFSSEAKVDAFLNDNEDYYDETEEQDPVVEVYRLNGQKVFEVAIESERKSVGVIDVSWRTDGVIIAILSSDSVVRLVNSFSGKVVHKFSTISSYPSQTTLPVGLSPGRQAKSPSSKRHSTSKVESSKKRRCLPSSLSYTTHFLDPTATSVSLGTANQENGLVLDDLLGLNADLNKLLRSKADLPKVLANIDVEAFLPKISTLPVGGPGDEEVFSNRTSIDAMFHPAKSPMKAGTVEVLVAGHDDGMIHMRIFDSFEIGDVDLNQANKMPAGLNLRKVKRIIGQPLTRKIFVIAEEEDKGPTATHTRSHGNVDVEGRYLHVISFDLRFIQHSAFNLPILATKSTQLSNLTRYLRQIEKQLAREVKTAFDLPSRYIRAINGELTEGDDASCTFETVAHHAILTGEVHPKMKEWLTEVVTERGVKRWEKAVGDCLDLVRRLISECWNPAVERAAVVVSRLTGLAKANVNGTLGIEEGIMEDLRDTVDVMAIVGEDVLREVGKEIVDFSVFMKWLKWEVEAAALEETSERLDEMRESSDHADLGTVLKYITHGLQESKIKAFLIGETTPYDVGDGKGSAQFYTQFKENRYKDENTRRPLTLLSLLHRLSKQCEQLFQQIAGTLRKAVLLQYGTKLPGDLDVAASDSRLLPSFTSNGTSKSATTFNVCAVAKHKQKHDTVICTQLHESSGKEIISEHQVGDATNILDIKFGSDSEVIVLVETQGGQKIYMANTIDLSQWSELHDFAVEGDAFKQAGMTPGSLEVNGRKKRRALAVKDVGGNGYAVFDLDSGDPEQQSRDDEDEVMTG